MSDREVLAFDLYGTLVDPIAIAGDQCGLASEISCHCGLLKCLTGKAGREGTSRNRSAECC